MSSDLERHMHLTIRRHVLNLLFFLLSYLYLWIVVKPHLIYHGFGTVVLNVPQFSTGWQFLRDSLEAPGGWVVYLYGLLSQAYAYSWLGSLVIVLAAFCLGELSRQHSVQAGHGRPTLLPPVPVILILLIYNRYDHALAVCLTVFAGLLFSLIFEKLPLCRRPARLGAFCLMAAFSYWLAGAGGLFVFTLTTTVYLLFRHGDSVSAVLTLLITATIIGGLGEYVFHVSPQQAFSILTPFSRDLTANMTPLSQILVMILFLFVPAAVSLAGLRRLGFSPNRDTSAKRTRNAKGRKPDRVTRSGKGALARATRCIVPATPILALALGLFLSDQKIHRQIVLMNYQARQKQWPDLLETAGRLPKTVYNIYCNHDINRALYHTGRLAHDLLRFPQTPEALLLTHEEESSFITQLIMCDTFLTMGNVDDAERLASEFLVDKGNTGALLEKLAWICIIKEQEQTAQVYLNALRKDLNCRRRADIMLNRLAHGFKPDEAAYINQIRACRRQDGDAGLHKESIEKMLTGLIEYNPNNRMAFEYLMTLYLLTGQVEKIADNYARIGSLAYQEVPILYEEAALMHHASRNQRLNLKQVNIRRKTFERFTQFITLCNALKGPNPQAAQQRLMREFGTSYFFYYRFTLRTRARASQG